MQRAAARGEHPDARRTRRRAAAGRAGRPSPADQRRRRRRAAARPAARAASRAPAVRPVDRARAAGTGTAVSVPTASRQRVTAIIGQRARRAARRRAAAATALRSTGTAATAPLPSPRRMPRSRIGSRPSLASASDWAGSVERCPAANQAAAPGAIRSAVSAQATDISPSSSTGTPASAAVEQEAGGGREVGTAERGQGLDRVVGPVAGAGQRLLDDPGLAGQRRRRRCRCRGRSTSLAGSPSPAATSAAAGVVLPMPMSPLISSWAPAAISSGATAAPAASALRVSIGGERVLEVDRAGCRAAPCDRCTSAGTSSRSSSTPRSSTRTADAVRPGQRRDRRPCPATKVRTIAAVISGGYAETPCAATPWSPAKIDQPDVVELARRHRALVGRQPDGRGRPAARAPRAAWPDRPAVAGARAATSAGRRRRSQAGGQLSAAQGRRPRSRYSRPTRPVSTTPMHGPHAWPA